MNAMINCSGITGRVYVNPPGEVFGHYAQAFARWEYLVPQLEVCRQAAKATMPSRPDQTSEAELIDLNRRIVECLRLIRSARQLVELARLTVGMLVEFPTDDGRTLPG